MYRLAEQTPEDMMAEKLRLQKLAEDSDFGITQDLFGNLFILYI